MKCNEKLKTAFEIAGKSVVLIGFMGSGKTSVAEAMEVILGARVVDTDAEIEKLEGTTIGEIFADSNKGEAYFRQKEREVIKSILNGNEPVILSTGGGAFMNDETRQLILNESNPVWLEVSAEIAYQRINDDFENRQIVRPIVHGAGTVAGGKAINTNDEQKEIIAHKLAERTPIYSECPYKVSVDESNPEQIAGSVLYDMYMRPKPQ